MTDTPTVTEYTGWPDLDTVRAVWPSGLDDDVLALYLDAAKAAVLNFAPTGDLIGIVDEDSGTVVVPIPDAWRLAQIMQARNTANAIRAQSGGDLDGDSYGLMARPLDWSVKQLLRPQHGRPLVG